MQATETLERLETRLRETVAEVGDREAALGIAQEAWGRAVADGDGKAEVSARKTLDAARDALQAVKERIPVLEAAIEKERRAALYPLAESLGRELTESNERARELAASLIESYESALATVSEIRKIYAANRKATAAFRARCRALDEKVPLPESAAHFPVNIKGINATFKYASATENARWGLTRGNIFIAPKADEPEEFDNEAA